MRLVAACSLAMLLGLPAVVRSQQVATAGDEPPVSQATDCPATRTCPAMMADCSEASDAEEAEECLEAED
jgi:hypothetical protein